MFDDWFDTIEAGPGWIDRYLFTETVLQQRFDLFGNGHWHLRGLACSYGPPSLGVKGKMANAID